MQDIRQHFPDAVCAAFTATATPRVRQDIKECLGFSQAREFVASFDRENLFLEVRPKENAWPQLLDFIRRFPEESGIVYCFTRKQVDSLYSALLEEGFSALPYHAGLNDVQRAENQEKFIRDDVRIVVATVAFGMGIDKPNIRFVVHYDLPKTLETLLPGNRQGGSRRSFPPIACFFWDTATFEKSATSSTRDKTRKKNESP